MADTNTELVPQDPNHATFDQIGPRRTTMLQGDPVEAGVVYPLTKNRTHVLDLLKEPNELAYRFITMLQGNPLLAEAAKSILETGGLALKWLQQPENQKIIMASVGTFAAIQILFAVAGFGVLGPVAGTLAPAWQSAMYGAFTPAGGAFATLQAMGMTGQLIPIAAGIGAAAAAAAGGLTWAFGRTGQGEERPHQE